MNAKKCKKLRSFIKETCHELPVESYVVGKNNVLTTIDEKNNRFHWEYTGTIRADVKSQKGQYRLLKKQWKLDHESR